MFAGLMGIILIPMMLYGIKKAKEDAREILRSPKNYDQKKFDRAYNALARMPNDLEAAHLWQQLNALKEAINQRYTCPQCRQYVQYGQPQCQCGYQMYWQP